MDMDMDKARVPGWVGEGRESAERYPSHGASDFTGRGGERKGRGIFGDASQHQHQPPPPSLLPLRPTATATAAAGDV